MILQNHFSIKDWFSEVKDWPASYTSSYRSTAAMTGHYTQVDKKNCAKFSSGIFYVFCSRLSGARPPKLVVDSSHGRAGFNQMPNIPTARSKIQLFLMFKNFNWYFYFIRLSFATTGSPETWWELLCTSKAPPPLDVRAALSPMMASARAPKLI